MTVYVYCITYVAVSGSICMDKKLISSQSSLSDRASSVLDFIVSWFFPANQAMFLWLVSWVAVVGEVFFLVLSLGELVFAFHVVSCTLPRCSRRDPTVTAAGLYYLAELIEEYSVLAKKIITSLFVVIYVQYS